MNATELEYFKDSKDRLQGEIKRLREVERQETEMIKSFEILIPKL